MCPPSALLDTGHTRSLLERCVLASGTVHRLREVCAHCILVLCVHCQSTPSHTESAQGSHRLWLSSALSPQIQTLSAVPLNLVGAAIQDAPRNRIVGFKSVLLIQLSYTRSSWTAPIIRWITSINMDKYDT